MHHQAPSHTIQAPKFTGTSAKWVIKLLGQPRCQVKCLIWSLPGCLGCVSEQHLVQWVPGWDGKYFSKQVAKLNRALGSGVSVQEPDMDVSITAELVRLAEH